MPLSKKKPIHIGILCAMPEEIGGTLENLKNISEYNYGDLKIFSGEWFKSLEDYPIYIAVGWSGWGKVSAARAATRMINFFQKDKSIDLLLFTGLAGSAKKTVNQWDIVIPDKLIQHDMDARPFFNQYEIPALKTEKIKAVSAWVDWAYNTLKDSIANKKINSFKNIEKGLIATADKFIADKESLLDLSKNLPGLVAVEMEGAAFAQVCVQERVSWLIIRVISDAADDDAGQTFTEFVEEYKIQAWSLIESLLNKLDEAPF